MNTKIATLLLITLFGLSSSYGQENWSLITESELSLLPNKYILKIQPILSDTANGGTGFFISPTCVLTNRHLVWNSNKNELHKSLLISAGFIGYDKAPLFGSEKVSLQKGVNVFLPENFLGNGNDFAMIKLSSDSLYSQIIPHEKNTFFFLTPFSVDSLDQMELNITGFTGWRRISKKKPRGRLYHAKAKYIKSLNNGEVQYKALSVRGGNSGSPIWIQRGDRFLIIGIHRRGAARIPEIFGKRHGVKWTAEKIDLISSWMKK